MKKNGGAQTLEWLVKAGDSLPTKGTLSFKAAEILKAGSNSALNFNLWEGEILDPITDNRPIGSLKIKGTDFDEGVIPAGAELICEYEMLDSGTIKLEVSVPSIGATFPSNHNFYSRQDGQLDFSIAEKQIHQDSETLEERVSYIERQGVSDPKIAEIKNKITKAKELTENNPDIERTQEAQEKLLEVKKILAQVRKNHLNEIRQMELDSCVAFFDENVREFAKPAEAASFDVLHRTAQRNIMRNSRDFEENLDEMKGYNFSILWKQDWFVVGYFKRQCSDSQAYSDENQFKLLVQQGENCIRNDDIFQLRKVIANLMSIRLYRTGIDDIMDDVNIIRG